MLVCTRVLVYTGYPFKCTNNRVSSVVFQVIDIKDEWTTLKGQMTQQASILQEVIRLQQRVGSHLDHEEWLQQHNRNKSEVEELMRELDDKLLTHEVCVIILVLSQSKYEMHTLRTKNQQLIFDSFQ